MQQDKRFVERLRRGEAKACAEFVDTFGGQIHRLVRRYVPGEADAEDVTQEIFVALFRGIANFRGDAALSTYVYRVAVNHCLKHCGRAASAPLPLEAMGEDPPDERRCADPVDFAVRRELSDTVQDALADLSPLHRDVVVLHELHELTYAECAAVLGVPIGTVKSRLFHAFSRLRVRLGGYVLGAEELPSRAEPVTETV